MGIWKKVKSIFWADTYWSPKYKIVEHFNGDVYVYVEAKPSTLLDKMFNQTVWSMCDMYMNPFESREKAEEYIVKRRFTEMGRRIKSEVTV